jgi:hypothetical protein
MALNFHQRTEAADSLGASPHVLWHNMTLREWKQIIVQFSSLHSSYCFSALGPGNFEGETIASRDPADRRIPGSAEHARPVVAGMADFDNGLSGCRKGSERTPL